MSRMSRSTLPKRCSTAVLTPVHNLTVRPSLICFVYLDQSSNKQLATIGRQEECFLEYTLLDGIEDPTVLDSPSYEDGVFDIPPYRQA